MTSVVVPVPVQFIEEGAFRMCSDLCELQLPETLSRIDPDAIVGCTELKKIYAPVGSYAEQWATECGFEVYYCR